MEKNDLYAITTDATISAATRATYQATDHSVREAVLLATRNVRFWSAGIEVALNEDLDG